MCGRAATVDKPADYKEFLPENFKLIEGGNEYDLNSLTELPPAYISYNVAPTSDIPVISNDHPGAVQLMSWKYDMKIQGKMIPLFNSKIEQASKSNSYFRYDLQERRCVVLLRGFYEWIKQDPDNKNTAKQPVFIHLKNSPVMPMAGIYKVNSDGKTGCSVITTNPLQSLEKVHNRMPFILQPDSVFDYLSPELNNNKEQILEWLSNNIVDNENLEYYPVNSKVGKVANNKPGLLNKCEPLFRF